jgi:hypothetical protein
MGYKSHIMLKKKRNFNTCIILGVITTEFPINLHTVYFILSNIQYIVWWNDVAIIFHMSIHLLILYKPSLQLIYCLHKAYLHLVYLSKKYFSD